MVRVIDIDEVLPLAENAAKILRKTGQLKHGDHRDLQNLMALLTHRLRNESVEYDAGKERHGKATRN